MKFSLFIASGQVLIPIALTILAAIAGLVCIFVATALYLQKEKRMRTILSLGSVGVLLLVPFYYFVFHTSTKIVHSGIEAIMGI